MVVEHELLPFWLYLAWSLVVLAGVVGFVLIAGYLCAAVLHGPFRAVTVTFQFVRECISDWWRTSPRRVTALGWLAFKESIRRRVIVAFGLFVVVLLFAGWFLDNRGDRAAEMYLNFVLTATTYLILVAGVVLSTFSLPADIRDRTIFTVVSKPVRRHEIVLGRVFGFMGTGTVLIAAMGVVSYLFVDRGLEHSHVLRENEISEESPAPAEENPVIRRGRTAMRHGHRHDVTFYEDGEILVDDLAGHTHDVEVRKSDGREVVVLGATRDMLRARVPIYGDLQFKDRQGELVAKGINVGKEWEYRSCIEGGSKSAAIWTLRDVREDRFPDGFIPLEMQLGVFRTYKGDVSKGILGSITLRNPSTGRESRPLLFTAKEYYTDRIDIPLTVDSPDGPVHVFQDLVDDEGRLEVEVNCEERAQFFCMARRDLYLRAGDAPFWWNFIKGHIGIWLQLLIVVSVGVAASTIVRGSVAMLLTIGVLMAGFFIELMQALGSGKMEGGGPVEAAIRIYLGVNPIVELEPGVYLGITRVIDGVMRGAVWILRHLVPDFRHYYYADFVAEGFNIDPAMLGQNIVGALLYVIPVLIAGHVCLKARQVA